MASRRPRFLGSSGFVPLNEYRITLSREAICSSLTWSAYQTFPPGLGTTVFMLRIPDICLGLKIPSTAVANKTCVLPTVKPSERDCHEREGPLRRVNESSFEKAANRIWASGSSCMEGFLLYGPISDLFWTDPSDAFGPLSGVLPKTPPQDFRGRL